MKRLLLALLVCAACKHSSSSSSTSHTETSTVTDTTNSESGATTTVTTTSEAPGKTTTTVEEFSPPENEQAGQGTPDEGPSGSDADAGLLSPPGRVQTYHGPLVRRTVTVSEHGQETTQTRQEASTQAQGATETRAAAKGDTTQKKKEEGSPALSCAFGGWLGIAGVIAALFGLGYLALKRLRA